MTFCDRETCVVGLRDDGETVVVLPDGLDETDEDEWGDVSSPRPRFPLLVVSLLFVSLFIH